MLRRLLFALTVTIIVLATALSLLPDTPVVAYDGDATYEVDRQWGAKRVEALTAYYNNQRGAGVKIAVIDYGTDCYGDTVGSNLHEDFVDTSSSNACKGGYDFDGDDENYTGSGWHGTVHAGMIGARMNGKGIVGVAPESELYPLKVTGGRESYPVWSTFKQALQWAIDNEMDIVSFTHGVWEHTVWPSDTLKSEIEDLLADAWDAGILLVGSAGNEDLPVAWPASDEHVIAVSALTRIDTRVQAYAYGSGGDTPRNEDLEFLAPGWTIYGPTYGPSSYTIGDMQGTSFAAPHVAGVAAVLWNTTSDGDYASSNGYINDDVRQRMRDEAYDLYDVGWDTESGYGIPLADTSRVFPQSLTSALGIVGAFDSGSTSAKIDWYEDGTIISTTNTTVYAGWTTFFYVPDTLEGKTDRPEVAARVYDISKPVSAAVLTSNSTPTFSQGYRGMVDMSQDPWQRTAGKTLYAPLVHIDKDQSVRLRITAAERESGSDRMVLKLTFRSITDTIINTMDTLDGITTGIEEWPAPNSVVIIPDSEIPWDRDVSIQVDVQNRSGEWYGNVVGMVETYFDDGSLTSYPLVNGGSANDGYLPRLMHGLDSWLTYVTFMNLDDSDTTVKLVYYPDGGGASSTYTTTISSMGVATLPDPGESYPDTNDEGAGVIGIDSGDGPIIAVARTGNASLHARGDNIVYMDMSANRAWQPWNMYNYYGWYCATPLMNLDDQNDQRLRTNFEWSGGFWYDDEWADPLNKYWFLNTGLTQNVIAGAEGLTINTTQVDQLGQCYHNGSGGNASWNSTESDPIPRSESDTPDVWFPSIHTGAD